jgi:hypothetical protein
LSPSSELSLFEQALDLLKAETLIGRWDYKHSHPEKVATISGEKQANLERRKERRNAKFAPGGKTAFSRRHAS